jgi:hypothetical protein
VISIQFRRGTKSDLDFIAARRELLPGEPFLLTDENRLAIATSNSTYNTFAIEGEGGGSTSTPTVITKSLTVGTAWQNTGIVYNDLDPGSYALEVYANDEGQKNQWYTGILTWRAGIDFGTGTELTDEVLLNSSGSSDTKNRFIRTLVSNNSTKLTLQIRTTYTNNNSYNYVFRFVKLL